MTALQQQYSEQGFCFLDAETIDENLLHAAQKGMLAVRDGLFDTDIPPSSHPGYDTSRLCKINDAHLASTGLYALLTESKLGEGIAAVTGSTLLQVWASQLLTSRLAQRKLVVWAGTKTDNTGNIGRKTKGCLPPGLRSARRTRNVARCDS